MLPFHEVCNVFPMMGEDDFRALKEDIAANGLREPIWTHEQQIIDGRNRLRACQELGVRPRFQEWDRRGSLVSFVVSLNFHRRHLTASQRAACAAEFEERLGIEAKERQRLNAKATTAERKIATPNETTKPTKVAFLPPSPSEKVERPKPQPKSREQAAATFNTSPRYVQDAKTVKTKAPDLHEKVKTGEITVFQAKRQVKDQEKRVEMKAKEEAIKAKAPEARPSRWEIRAGNCLEILPSLDAGSARLVFADPPYNIDWDYGQGGHQDRMAEDDFLSLLRCFIDASVRILTDDGSLWILINHEWAAHAEIMMREAGLEMLDWITWYESFGQNRSRQFNRTSRRLLHAVKSLKRYVFNDDAIRRPSDRQEKYHDKRADPLGKLWDDVWGINPAIPRLVGNAAERLPDASNQLPLALLTPIIGCASDPGDLIIDPFNGSGSTGEAAIRLGRRYLGIENDPKFVELSRRRLTIAEGETENAA
jgi:DNA modification methylase/ParB-like chromosome segregation protein Spo0J